MSGVVEFVELLLKSKSSYATAAVVVEYRQFGFAFARQSWKPVNKQGNNTIKAGGSTARAQNVGLDGVEWSGVGDTP